MKINTTPPPPSQPGRGEGTLKGNRFFRPNKPDENQLPQLPPHASMAEQAQVDSHALQMEYAQQQINEDPDHPWNTQRIDNALHPDVHDVSGDVHDVSRA